MNRYLIVIVAPIYIFIWMLFHPRTVWKQAKKEFKEWK